MHLAWKLIWLCVGVTLIEKCSSQVCDIGTIAPPSDLDEDASSDAVLWESAIVTGVILDTMSFNISSECNEIPYDHADAFKIEIDDTTDPPGTFKMIFKPGDKYRDYVDLIPRTKSTSTRLHYTCNGVAYERPVLAFWIDKNNRAPQFLDSTPLSYSIKTNWDKGVALNWKARLQITDQDYDYVNALPPIISTDRDDVFEITATPLFDNSVPPPPSYLWDVEIFIKEDYQLVQEIITAQITVSDGVLPSSPPISITLDIGTVNDAAPLFSQASYHHKLTNWPAVDDQFTPDQEILATDPDDSGLSITYSLDSTEIEFLDEEDPTVIKFLTEIPPSDPRRLIIVDVIATITKGGIPLESRASLIIELPSLTNPVFTTGAEFVTPVVDWNAEAGQPTDIIVQDAIEDTWATPTFSIKSVYPPELFDSIQVEATNNNNLHVKYQDILEDSTEIRNNVVLVTIEAQLGTGDNLRTTSATMALYFPEKIVPTTQPSTDCPTTADDVSCPPCTTDTPTECTTVIMPSTCPEPIDCPETPDPSSGTCPPPVCPTEVPTTCEPTTCEITDPPTGTCPPCITTTTFPTEPPCPTEPTTCLPCEECNSTATTTDCSTFTCPPATDCPITCPPENECGTSPEPVTDPSTCPTQTPCPITCETPAPCPTTSEPSTCPTQTPCPTTCPTQTPCPTTCPTCPTQSPCPTGPVTTQCPVTCPPQDECGTTPEPSECPTSCPPVEACPTTANPIICPSSPAPPTPCPECPITCPSTPGPCPECPTSPTTCPPSRDDDCEPCSESSNTGLLAGIIAVSVLLVASLGLAGFLYKKWKSVSSFSSYSSHSPPSNNNPRISFAQPENKPHRDFEEDNGWMNPTFDNPVIDPTSSALEQVLTHPEPSTSAAAFASPAVSPYMTAPIPGVGGEGSIIKSSLAKPKEIAPDYEEGLGLSKSSDTTPTKPKTGVKIADEVEIINNNDTEGLIQDERL